MNSTYKQWTRQLVTLGIIVASVPSYADEVKSPDGTKPTITEPAKGTAALITYEVFSKDGAKTPVVKAATEKSTIAAAKAHLMKTGGIKAVIQVPSGTALLLCGESGYRSIAGNHNASMHQSQLAAQRAFQNAKVNLAAHYFGLTVEAKADVFSSASTWDSTQPSLANVGAVQSSTVKESVAGFIRGYAVHAVDHDPVRKKWKAWLVVSPKTRGEYQQISGGLVLATSLEKTVDYVNSRISSGVMPPAGVQIITAPDGSVATVAWGSAILPKHKQPHVERQLEQVAYRTAGLRSSREMLEAMEGSQVSWESGFSEKYLDDYKEFAKIAEDDPTTSNELEIDVRSLDRTRETFKRSFEQRSAFTAVSSGEIPPGTISRTFKKDGVVYFSRTHLQRLEELAIKGRRSLSDVNKQPKSPSPTLPPANPGAAKGENDKDRGTLLQRPKGIVSPKGDL